jgi:hypothetical protein
VSTTVVVLLDCRRHGKQYPSLFHQRKKRKVSTSPWNFQKRKMVRRDSVDNLGALIPFNFILAGRI